MREERLRELKRSTDASEDTELEEEVIYTVLSNRYCMIGILQ